MAKRYCRSSIQKYLCGNIGAYFMF